MELKNKLIAVNRAVIWRAMHHMRGDILITEFPKSGGTWLGTMISQISGIPFPRNKFPGLWGPEIIHGHHLYKPHMKKAIAVVRDGRDVMVSLYYHFLFKHEHNSPQLINEVRSYLRLDDPDDIRANLPSFIKYIHEVWSKGRYRMDYSEFIDSVYDSAIPHCVSYEGMLADTVSVCRGILDYYEIEYDLSRIEEVVDANTFEKLAKRKSGVANNSSFLRKGTSGDWVNQFTDETAQVFCTYYGDSLIKAGYEQNKSWC